MSARAAMLFNLSIGFTRMNKIQIPVKILWLSGLLFFAAIPTPAAPSKMNRAPVLKAANITLAVDAKNSGASIPSDFSGLSFEMSQLLPNANGVHYFRADNQPLIRLFHTLGIKNLRIGGNTSDRDAKKLPGEADIDSLFAFAKAAGVKVIYCLRLHNGDPQTDARIAKYIMDHYANEIACFSIGQEPSAYPKIAVTNSTRIAEGMGGSFEKFPYSAYAAEWKKFADTIIAAAPGAKFCGPSVHKNGAWARQFMADFGQSNHVTLITEHLYPGGAGGKVKTPEIGRDRMLSDSFIKVYQKLCDSFVPLAVSNGLPYRLEEVNNYFNGGAKDVSDTFASALWGLDFMYWWAAHGAAGLNFHTGDKVAAGYTLRPSKYTAFFSTTNGFLVRPLGYGIKAFDLGSHGKFISAKISNPENLNLSVYAILGDDKHLYITIINKEHGESARDANVTLAGGTRFSSAQIISLTAPNDDIAATAGTRLGGAEIKNDGSWNGKWTSLGKNEIGAFAMKISAASASIIRLTGN
ncbi:MAG: hypothetical protein ACREFE_08830 [Limisphaerales bacterium]